MKITPQTDFSLNHTRRKVSGVLCLDKPPGITSNTALQIVKQLYKAKKAGHTGSLDPLASGMLPICFGEATKFSQFLLEADKTYEVTAKLGLRTTTSDSEGEVVCERPVPSFTEKHLETILEKFRGDIQQIPSMFSAIKYQGQPLYKLARKGITVPRQARTLKIFQLDLLAINKDTISLYIHCSKGTYVRTLIDDIGEALGCGAHVTVLRRLNVGPYQPQEMISLQQLRNCYESGSIAALDQYLLPIESIIRHLSPIQINHSLEFYLRQGQSIMVSRAPLSGLVRFHLPNGEFAGVGEVQKDGKVAPKRMLGSVDISLPAAKNSEIE